MLASDFEPVRVAPDPECSSKSSSALAWGGVVSGAAGSIQSDSRMLHSLPYVSQHVTGLTYLTE